MSLIDNRAFSFYAYISTSFKTEEEFDQAKVTHRFWTLEN